MVVEHNTDVMRAADWVIDLGPGAGPQGGRLLYAGPTAGLLDAPQSATAAALRAEQTLRPAAGGAAMPVSRLSPSISIRNAHANNLMGVDVDFPKGALTVVTGLSGSGKSSLVGDVLETEARRRFLESLSMYERQGAHEGKEAMVGSVSGLGVAVTISPERSVYSRRATVGTATRAGAPSGGAAGRGGYQALPALRCADGAAAGLALPVMRHGGAPAELTPFPAHHLRRGLPDLSRRRHAAAAQSGQAHHSPGEAALCGCHVLARILPEGLPV